MPSIFVNPFDHFFGPELFEGTNPFAPQSVRRSPRTVRSAHAPAPVGPYSQAVHAHGMLFCSGQVPLDPATGRLIEGDVGTQTQRVLANLEAVLAAAGMTSRAIVKTTVFLVDMNDFAAVNAVYGDFFNHEPPARTTIGVAALPLGARVEIEAIAVAH